MWTRPDSTARVMLLQAAAAEALQTSFAHAWHWPWQASPAGSRHICAFPGGLQASPARIACGSEHASLKAEEAEGSRFQVGDLHGGDLFRDIGRGAARTSPDACCSVSLSHGDTVAARSMFLVYPS